MAAAQVTAPSLLRCAGAEARVGKDPRLFLPLLRREGLLVEGRGTRAAASPVRYCPATVPGASAEVRRWFLEAPAAGHSSSLKR
jgi:hypothetical protein